MLHLAEQPAATSPELPDNVRYLFQPVLTDGAQPAEPPTTAGPRLTTGAPHPATETAAEPAVAEPATETAAEPAPGAPAATGAEPPFAEMASRPNVVTTAGTHRRAAASASNRLRRRVTLVAAALTVVSTAAGTAFALVRHAPVTNSAGHQGHAVRHSTRDGRSSNTGLPGLFPAAIARAQAARWVARELSKSVIVACEDVMCSELLNEGIAASNLLVLSSTAPSPLGADVVMATHALRHQFGQRLAGEYAPTVIASFGAGKSRVDVRVVAPEGAAAYELALNRDLAARQRYGSVLLSNSGISVSASARPDLVAGLVDPRLLMMLPVLANQHPIRILGFYDRAPRSAQGVPLSGAELAGYDASAGLSAGGYLRWLLVFLRGQRAPYWPTSVTSALINGHRIVRVRFSRPSPIGFLNGQ
jgi:hypothetical protein